MFAILWFVLFLFLLFFALSLLIWIQSSVSHFSWVQLRSGYSYVIHDRRYTFPNLKTPKFLFLLTSLFVTEARELFVRATKLLEKMRWCVSGPTLLGLALHNSIPLPYDDGPMQVAVFVPDHTSLFTDAFALQATMLGLTIEYRARCNQQAGKTCTKRGVVRFGFPNKDVLLDVVIWEEVQKEVCFVTRWLEGKRDYDRRVCFAKDSVLPLQCLVRDGLEVRVPNNAHSILLAQYGHQVLEQTQTQYQHVHRALRFEKHLYQDMVDW